MDSIQQKQKKNVSKITSDDIACFDNFQKRIIAHHGNHKRSLRYAHGGFRTYHFYTEDTHRYTTPQQQRLSHKKMRHIDTRGAFESVHVRSHRKKFVSETVHQIVRRQSRRNIVAPLIVAVASWRCGLQFNFSIAKAWNLSLVGAMLFGMMSMTMIYKSFGQSVRATEITATPIHEGQLQALLPVSGDIQDTGVQEQRDIIAFDAVVVRDKEQELFEARAHKMVAGYPIEKMLPEIFKQDRTVAAFMIAMAKQESQWGRRIPVLNGQDCLNYWGFRSKRARMGTGGHTCFDSNADAVKTVGRRMHDLVYKYKRTTPERLIVWKCGYSCEGHDQSNVASWKRTVGMYYDILMKKE